MPDSTKYPWIKSIFKKKTADRCVYAGPEYFEKRNGSDKAQTGPVMQAVYAAPVFKKDPALAEGVYAGPAPIGRAPIGRVYAGPEPETDTGTGGAGPLERPEAEIEDVYAGPEFFCAGEEPGEAPGSEAEEEAEKPDLPPFPGPDPTQFLCVYAGPEYFSGMNKPIGQYVPNASFAQPGSVKCGACGFFAPPGAKFCPECGRPLVKEA